MRHCEQCGKPLHEASRDDMRFCSGKCRVANLRANARALAKTKGAKVITDGTATQPEGGYHAVTASPLPTPPSSFVTASSPPQTPAPRPSKYTEEELRIPDDLTIPKFLRREPGAPHWKLLDAPADETPDHLP